MSRLFCCKWQNLQAVEADCVSGIAVMVAFGGEADIFSDSVSSSQ